MKKKKKYIVDWIKIPVFFILIVVGMFFVAFFLFNKGDQMARCYIRGFKWLNFGLGPTGCYKNYPDGGKSCTSGNECVAKNCVVDGLYFNDKKKPMENLLGKCPNLGPAYGEYSILCGSASIEAGKVVEDMRSCMY